MPQPRITLVVGARPNFMKAAALIPALRAEGLRVRLVHTGQHDGVRMSGRLFRDLRLPRPDRHLGVGPGPQAAQTARILARMDAELAAHPPEALLVVGDVNSTLAAALAATKRGIPVAHVEAGLRSGDRRMPEEINRILTDHLSDLLFTTTAGDDRVLRREGIPAVRIRRVGNVMADTLLAHRRAARGPGASARERFGLTPKAYGVVTLHRPGNVDDPGSLKALIGALAGASRLIPLVFPVHPRTRRLLPRMRLPPTLHLSPPLGYLEFLGLLDGAALALTDSGGVQHETTLLGVPCLTLRDSTEWKVTCRLGTNRLIGTDPDAIVRATARVFRHPPRGKAPPLWDGRSGPRVAKAVKTWLRAQKQ
jgi:UDP-N-acetylglucosamine 2-epimerase (non-hydrolysing)